MKNYSSIFMRRERDKPLLLILMNEFNMSVCMYKCNNVCIYTNIAVMTNTIIQLFIYEDQTELAKHTSVKQSRFKTSCFWNYCILYSYCELYQYIATQNEEILQYEKLNKSTLIYFKYV